MRFLAVMAPESHPSQPQRADNYLSSLLVQVIFIILFTAFTNRLLNQTTVIADDMAYMQRTRTLLALAVCREAVRPGVVQHQDWDCQGQPLHRWFRYMPCHAWYVPDVSNT